MSEHLADTTTSGYDGAALLTCAEGRQTVHTIFEKSRTGRRAGTVPAAGVPERSLGDLLPPALRRARPARLPEVAEIDLVRHYTELSALTTASRPARTRSARAR